jgi:hypothetical protein
VTARTNIVPCFDAEESRTHSNTTLEVRVLICGWEAPDGNFDMHRKYPSQLFVIFLQFLSKDSGKITEIRSHIYFLNIYS